MSRTHRRRHDRWAVLQEIPWYLGRWSCGGLRPRWQDYLDLSPTTADINVVRIITGRFHRDRDFSDRNAPAWFRRMLNAHHRARQKAALRRTIAEGRDDVPPALRRRSNWDWF